MVLYSDNSEAVEWVNMCWRKVRGLQGLQGHLEPSPAVPWDRKVAAKTILVAHLHLSSHQALPCMGGCRRVCQCGSCDLTVCCPWC